MKKLLLLIQIMLSCLALAAQSEHGTIKVRKLQLKRKFDPATLQIVLYGESFQMPDTSIVSFTAAFVVSGSEFRYNCMGRGGCPGIAVYYSRLHKGEKIFFENIKVKDANRKIVSAPGFVFIKP